MNEYRFVDRIAIVTGAGRGIGRAYAHLLAERGASVVVNDLGGSMEGFGADAQPAQDVAAEIVAAGGTALASTSDVSTAEGSQEIIDAAIKQFGRVDVLINNAGIIRWAGLPEIEVHNLQHHLAVHLVGSFNTTRAAWPHMLAQGYGRIVMTSSVGIFGLPANISYAAAKAGVIGLARSIATAGAAHNIKINVIAPAAHTRMGTDPATGQPLSLGGLRPEEMPPEFVAPMVAYLAHEACPTTGEIYQAGARRLARMFIASTEGYVHPSADLTIEDVAKHWATINDETGYYVPTDLLTAPYMAHFAPVEAGSEALISGPSE